MCALLFLFALARQASSPLCSIPNASLFYDVVPAPTGVLVVHDETVRFVPRSGSVATRNLDRSLGLTGYASVSRNGRYAVVGGSGRFALLALPSLGVVVEGRGELAMFDADTLRLWGSLSGGAPTGLRVIRTPVPRGRRILTATARGDLLFVEGRGTSPALLVWQAPGGRSRSARIETDVEHVGAFGALAFTDKTGVLALAPSADAGRTMGRLVAWPMVDAKGSYCINLWPYRNGVGAVWYTFRESIVRGRVVTERVYELSHNVRDGRRAKLAESVVNAWPSHGDRWYYLVRRPDGFDLMEGRVSDLR